MLLSERMKKLTKIMGLLAWACMGSESPNGRKRKHWQPDFAKMLISIEEIGWLILRAATAIETRRLVGPKMRGEGRDLIPTVFPTCTNGSPYTVDFHWTPGEDAGSALAVHSWIRIRRMSLEVTVQDPASSKESKTT